MPEEAKTRKGNFFATLADGPVTLFAMLSYMSVLPRWLARHRPARVAKRLRPRTDRAASRSARAKAPATPTSATPDAARRLARIDDRKSARYRAGSVSNQELLAAVERVAVRPTPEGKRALVEAFFQIER